jgi:streptogramin lyase
MEHRIVGRKSSRFRKKVKKYSEGMMKVKKGILFLIIGLFLASCGPVTPNMTTSVVASPAEQEKLSTPVPVNWPESDEDWIGFSNEGSFFQTVVYDPSGFLWAIKDDSVYCWHIEKKDFVKFTVDDGLPKDLRHITFFDGKIWVLADNGQVATYSEGNWITRSIGSSSLSSLIDTGDRLWALGADIYYLEGSSWKKFDLIPTEFQGYYDDVAESKDGSLWFLSYDRILRFDGVDWREYKSFQGVSDLLTLSDGTLLFMFYDQVYYFDGNKLSPVALSGEYYRYPIKSYFLTPQKDLWMQLQPSDFETPNTGATYLIHNRVVSQIPDQVFNNFPDEDIYVSPSPVAMFPQGWAFLTNDASTIYLYDGRIWTKLEMDDASSINQLANYRIIDFAADGTLWVIENGNPARFDGNKLLSVFSEKDMQCPYLYEYRIDSNGSLWGFFYGSNILCNFNVETGQITKYELHFIVDNLATGPNGQVWVGSNAGFIAELTPEFLKTNDYEKIDMIKVGGNTVNFKLSPSRIEIGPDGAVWVFVKDSGLYGYHDTEWKYYGLAGMQDASALTIDLNGHVWAGFCGKLLENDGEKWITHSQGCMAPTKLVTALDNSIWFINGGDGVYHFDGVDLTHFDNEQFGGHVPDRILVAPDGAIWFSSYDGLQRYKP